MMTSLHSFRGIGIELLQFGYNLSPNHYKMAFHVTLRRFAVSAAVFDPVCAHIRTPAHFVRLSHSAGACIFSGFVV